MKVLFWNVRGVVRKKQIAVDILRDLENRKSFDIIALAEPKISPRSGSTLRLGLYRGGNIQFYLGGGQITLPSAVN